MSDDTDGKLPARTRKPTDEAAQAARQQEPAIGVDALRHLQAAIAKSEDDRPAD